MLQNDYARLAKGVDYISDEQAKRIIGIVLNRIKDDANAAIVDVWTHKMGRDNIAILEPYVRRCNQGTPSPQVIFLTESVQVSWHGLPKQNRLSGLMNKTTCKVWAKSPQPK